MDHEVGVHARGLADAGGQLDEGAEFVCVCAAGAGEHYVWRSAGREGIDGVAFAETGEKSADCRTDAVGGVAELGDAADYLPEFVDDVEFGEAELACEVTAD